MSWIRKKKDPLEHFRNRVPDSISLVSPAFGNGDRIPVKYTCDGLDVSPPLRISNVPRNAVELVLLMYDVDAPSGIFYHWLLYAMPPDLSELPEGVPQEEETDYGVQGRNDFGRIGYNGPCPPHGGRDHRYYFVLLALNEESGLGPGASPQEVLDSVIDNVIAYGVLMGTYGRGGSRRIFSLIL
ncbi:MAG: YbhB/YbcL family Raf kinase inhibitor-like protein [Staphylothermus sp.]|nr:YbhB/YbcL family Raf kinase inhibitor-like protein [Staphylothermus sp.]